MLSMINCAIPQYLEYIKIMYSCLHGYIMMSNIYPLHYDQANIVNALVKHDDNLSIFK